MALSGSQKTRIGGYLAGVGKAQSFIAKANGTVVILGGLCATFTMAPALSGTITVAPILDGEVDIESC